MDKKAGRPRLNHAVETFRNIIVSYFVVYKGEEFDATLDYDADDEDITVTDGEGNVVTDQETIKGIKRVIDKCIVEQV